MTTERTDLATALGKTALLSSLTPAELKTLAARTVRKLFTAGELLFSEGEPCNGLHIIAQGKVRIFKTSVNGREQVLAVNVPGESVAELPVFDGGPFPASAVAIEDAEIAFISRRDFQAYCMEHPEVALKVLQVVGARLRRLVGIIEELSFTTIRQRLISSLAQTRSERRQEDRSRNRVSTSGNPSGTCQPTGNSARVGIPQPDAPAGRGTTGRGRATDRRKGSGRLEGTSRDFVLDTFRLRVT